MNALITGVSRREGIGFAIAERLAALGADLYLTGYEPYDREPFAAGMDGSVGDAAAALRTGGSKILSEEVDLSDPNAPEELITRAVDELGPLGALVIDHCYSDRDGIGGLRASDIDKHLILNVRAHLLLIQAWATSFDESWRPGDPARGACVFITSGQDKASMPEELAYAASKGAMTSILPSLAHSLGVRGLRINAVDPGPTESYDVEAQTPGATAWVRDRTPLGRWGRPTDAARVAAWLAGPEAEWVTGQLIHSDGGFRD